MLSIALRMSYFILGFLFFWSCCLRDLELILEGSWGLVSTCSWACNLTCRPSNWPFEDILILGGVMSPIFPGASRATSPQELFVQAMRDALGPHCDASETRKP